MDCQNHPTKYSIIKLAHDNLTKNKGLYEFIYEAKSLGMHYFSQTYFPHECTEKSGQEAPGYNEIKPISQFQNVNHPFKGLCKRANLLPEEYDSHQLYAYIDGSPQKTNWHYPIGQFSSGRESAVPLGGVYEYDYIRLWVKVPQYIPTAIPISYSFLRFMICIKVFVVLSDM